MLIDTKTSPNGARATLKIPTPAEVIRTFERAGLIVSEARADEIVAAVSAGDLPADWFHARAQADTVSLLPQLLRNVEIIRADLARHTPGGPFHQRDTQLLAEMEARIARLQQRQARGLRTGPPLWLARNGFPQPDVAA